MVDENQNIVITVNNKYIMGNQLYQRIYRLLQIPIVNNSIYSNVEMIAHKLL